MHMLRACKAIAEFVASDAALARQMIESDGCAALASALRDHSGRPAICACACAALIACWAGKDGEPSPAVSKAASAQTGCFELVATVRHHAGDSAVCVPAYRALALLRHSDASLEQLFESGAVSSILETLWIQVQGPDALADACASGLHFVASFALSSEERAETLVSAGAIRCALAALERRAANEAVCTSGCHVLASVLLRVRDECRREIAGDGRSMLTAALKALARHPESNDIAKNAAAVLWYVRPLGVLDAAQEDAVKAAAFTMFRNCGPDAVAINRA